MTYVDDYAHLPSEVRATLAAARQGRWERVVAVFQPHRYSRTAALGRDFGGAFEDADVVVVTGIYPAGEEPLPGVSGLVGGRSRAGLVSRASGSSTPRPAPTSWRRCAGLLRPGDLCLTMGAGRPDHLADELLAGPRAPAGRMRAVMRAVMRAGS